MESAPRFISCLYFVLYLNRNYKKKLLLSQPYTKIVIAQFLYTTMDIMCAAKMTRRQISCVLTAFTQFCSYLYSFPSLYLTTNYFIEQVCKTYINILMLIYQMGARISDLTGLPKSFIQFVLIALSLDKVNNGNI